MPNRSRLLHAVRQRVRRLGIAKRTEEAYVGWIRRSFEPATSGIPATSARVRLKHF